MGRTQDDLPRPLRLRQDTTASAPRAPTYRDGSKLPGQTVGWGFFNEAPTYGAPDGRRKSLGELNPALLEVDDRVTAQKGGVTFHGPLRNRHLSSDPLYL